MRIAGQASFLTGDDHTIHAWVHGPQSGQVRGAVVVAPALAREEVVSHRSMRLVAARAAQAAAAQAPGAAVEGLAGRVRRLGQLARAPQTGAVHQYFLQAVAVLAVGVMVWSVYAGMG